MASLLSQGADPNAQDASGNTVLVIGIAAGRLDIVQSLLAAGADPTFTGGRGVKGVHLVADNDNPAAILATDSRGWAPLHHAAWSAWPDIVETLICNGSGDSTPVSRSAKPEPFPRSRILPPGMIVAIVFMCFPYGPGEYEEELAIVFMCFPYGSGEDKSRSMTKKFLTKKRPLNV